MMIVCIIHQMFYQSKLWLNSSESIHLLYRLNSGQIVFMRVLRFLSLAFFLLLLAVLVLDHKRNSVVPPTSTSLSSQANQQVYLDVHYHFNRLAASFLRSNRNPEKDFLSNRKQNLVERVFFISDAYLIPNIATLASDSEESLKYSENESASEFFKKYPENFGLCSINLLWEDAAALAEKCLKLSNMVGVKIHFMRSQLTGIDSLNNRRFLEILSLIESKKGILLVHASGHMFSQKEGALAYTKDFLNLANRFSNVKFIVAHSAYQTWIGFNGLVEIGNYFQQNPGVKRNIYIDTSAFFLSMDHGSTEVSNDFKPKIPTDEYIISHWRKNNDIVETWRKFGMDHVLFGSDFPFYDIATEIRVINLCPFLTADEKKKILRDNGEKFLADLDLVKKFN